MRMINPFTSLEVSSFVASDAGPPAGPEEDSHGSPAPPGNMGPGLNADFPLTAPPACN